MGNVREKNKENINNEIKLIVVYARLISLEISKFSPGCNLVPESGKYLNMYLNLCPFREAL